MTGTGGNGGGSGGSGGSSLVLGLAGEGNGGGTARPATCDDALTTPSAVGCDYYAVHPLGVPSPLFRTDFAGSCYAAVVANNSAEAVAIELEHAGNVQKGAQFARIPSGSGQAITYAPLPDGKLPPGEVALLFLSSVSESAGEVVACPPGVEVAAPLGTSLGAAGGEAMRTAARGGAFRIRTSAPVAAYDIFPYGGGSTAIASASLLYPTSTWGTNYVAVDAYQQEPTQRNYSSIVAFVAAEDDTEVELRVPIDLVEPDLALDAARGKSTKLSLNRGDVVRLHQAQSLNGSVLQSNRPLGLWGGSAFLTIPLGYLAGDMAHQQIPPVSMLGSEYVAVTHRSRYEGPAEAPPWRLLGVVPGTVLSYEPAAPAGAPTTLEDGQLATFFAAGPLVIKSQDAAHPFYMSAHMTGCDYAAEKSAADSYGDCRGDPEFVNVVPTAQYLGSYSFFTDPTYPETNLVIVRKKSNGAFADVQLDCAGPITGFEPISADYEYARIDLVRGDFEKQGNCDNGRHVIDSAGPFGVTVWGWGSGATGGSFGASSIAQGFYSQAVSYAYPAGAGAARVNDVNVPIVK